MGNRGGLVVAGGAGAGAGPGGVGAGGGGPGGGGGGAVLGGDEVEAPCVFAWARLPAVCVPLEHLVVDELDGSEVCLDPEPGHVRGRGEDVEVESAELGLHPALRPPGAGAGGGPAVVVLVVAVVVVSTVLLSSCRLDSVQNLPPGLGDRDTRPPAAVCPQLPRLSGQEIVIGVAQWSCCRLH